MLTNVARLLEIQATGEDIEYADLKDVPGWARRCVTFVAMPG